MSIIGNILQAAQSGESTADLFSDYGIVGLIVWIVVRDIVPWAKKRFDKSQDSDAKVRESQAARQAANDERMLKAMDRIADATEATKSAISAINVRLELIERHVGLTPEVQVEQAKTERRTAPRGNKQ